MSQSTKYHLHVQLLCATSLPTGHVVMSITQHTATLGDSRRHDSIPERRVDQERGQHGEKYVRCGLAQDGDG